MAPEDGSLLHILSKWSRRAGLWPTHVYAFFFLVNLCWLFFFSSYSVPKFFAFLFSCHSLHSLITFTFLLAYRASAFIISISICFPLILIHLCYSFSLQKGWKTYFFSKTMIDPPSSLRLFLDSLLEGRRAKRSSSWCRWTRSSQVTSSPSPFLSLTDFSKKISRSPLFLVSKGESVHAFGMQYRAFYHAPPV